MSLSDAEIEALFESSDPGARAAAGCFVADAPSEHNIGLLEANVLTEKDCWTISGNIEVLLGIDRERGLAAFNKIIAAVDNPPILTNMLILAHAQNIKISDHVLEKLRVSPAWFVRLAALQYAANRHPSGTIRHQLLQLLKEIDSGLAQPQPECELIAIEGSSLATDTSVARALVIQLLSDIPDPSKQ